MGWIEAIAVMLVIAIAAAAGGFWASVVALRKKSRARGPFLVGVLCGLMAGVALTGRRRGLTDGIAAGALTVVASIVRRGPAPLMDEFKKRCLPTGSKILQSALLARAPRRLPSPGKVKIQSSASALR